MNYFYDPKENEPAAAARDSFSGRLLTDAQFDEAMAITGIVEREIRTSGTFKEKLGDYAYAFARTERFDAVKAETIIRDLFKARTGQSMNQMREELAKREEKLPAQNKALVMEYANAVGQMIEEGDKVSFNRAFAHQAQSLAEQLGITDAGAKRIMKEEFQAAEGRDLYDWGKEVEERFYRPQIEAEKQQRSRQSAEADGDGGPNRSRNDYGRGEARGGYEGDRNGAARGRSRVGPRP